MPDVDVLILGGGCAGLSLALRLAEAAGGSGRAMVLEARPSFQHDRTWCFWRLGPHRFDPLVRRSWSRVRVRERCRSASVELDVAAHPYQILESGAFYEEACARIASAPHVDLVMGSRVQAEPVRRGDLWAVDTDRGTVTARQVVDTRPPVMHSDSVLWQSFVGHEVETPTACFDAGCATLMEFAEQRPDGVTFTYILPLAPDRALIETTVFGPQPLMPPSLAATQQQALERHLGGLEAELIRLESGVLPMGLVSLSQPSPPGLVRAGLMHGAARPSTGYTFVRLQRWADACAASLRAGGPVLPVPPDPAVMRGMDALFLRVLRRMPQLGPELFVALFTRVAGARLVRFLSDVPTAGDLASVVAALPPRLFLTELLRGGVAS